MRYNYTGFTVFWFLKHTVLHRSESLKGFTERKIKEPSLELDYIGKYEDKSEGIFFTFQVTASLHLDHSKICKK